MKHYVYESPFTMKDKEGNKYILTYLCAHDNNQSHTTSSPVAPLCASLLDHAGRQRKLVTHHHAYWLLQVDHPPQATVLGAGGDQLQRQSFC